MSSDYAAIYDLVPDTIFSHTDDSPFKKLWMIYAERMQALQDIIDELHYIRVIENQSGAILDLIGEFLHETRKGNDEEYKASLMIAFIKLFCSGGIDALQNVLRSLAGDDFLGIYHAEDSRVNDTLYLDGTWKLDGTYYLSGSYARPAFYVVCMKAGSSYIDLAKLILPSIKVGGIGYRIKEVA